MLRGCECAFVWGARKEICPAPYRAQDLILAQLRGILTRERSPAFLGRESVESCFSAKALGNRFPTRLTNETSNNCIHQASRDRLARNWPPVAKMRNGLSDSRFRQAVSPPMIRMAAPFVVHGVESRLTRIRNHLFD